MSVRSVIRGSLVTDLQRERFATIAAYEYMHNVYLADHYLSHMRWLSEAGKRRIINTLKQAGLIDDSDVAWLIRNNIGVGSIEPEKGK